MEIQKTEGRGDMQCGPVNVGCLSKQCEATSVCWRAGVSGCLLDGPCSRCPGTVSGIVPWLPLGNLFGRNDNFRFVKGDGLVFADKILDEG